MKILGCFKIVPDLDLVAEEDWKADEQLRIDTGYVKPLWNCFDEGALEMMLKLSDQSEGFDVVYELSAFTVGKQKHESFLKTLYALGFASGARAELKDDAPFCPEMIAETIADYVKYSESQDVVITGTQSSDGSNRKTPYLLAEILGWPCIDQVTGLEPVDEHCLKVISQVQGGSLIQTVKTPCVLAVGNAPCAYLRVPTLKDKMTLGKKPVIHVEGKAGAGAEQAGQESAGQEGAGQKGMWQISTGKLTALTPVDRSRSAVLIEGETPKEKAVKLYEEYLKGRLEAL